MCMHKFSLLPRNLSTCIGKYQCFRSRWFPYRPGMSFSKDQDIGRECVQWLWLNCFIQWSSAITLKASANYFANPVSGSQDVIQIQHHRLSNVFFLFTTEKPKALGWDLLLQTAELGSNPREKSRHTSTLTSKHPDSPWSVPRVLV